MMALTRVQPQDRHLTARQPTASERVLIAVWEDLPAAGLRAARIMARRYRGDAMANLSATLSANRSSATSGTDSSDQYAPKNTQSLTIGMLRP